AGRRELGGERLFGLDAAAQVGSLSVGDRDATAAPPDLLLILLIDVRQRDLVCSIDSLVLFRIGRQVLDSIGEFFFLCINVVRSPLVFCLSTVVLQIAFAQPILLYRFFGRLGGLGLRGCGTLFCHNALL